jgi:hypothetical protein
MRRITEVSPSDESKVVDFICTEIDNARARITSEASWDRLAQFFYEALLGQHTLSAAVRLTWMRMKKIADIKRGHSQLYVGYSHCSRVYGHYTAAGHRIQLAIREAVVIFERGDVRSVVGLAHGVAASRSLIIENSECSTRSVAPEYPINQKPPVTASNSLSASVP